MIGNLTPLLFRARQCVTAALVGGLAVGCSTGPAERPGKDDYDYVAEGFCRDNVEQDIGDVEFTRDEQFDIQIDGELKRVVTGVATDKVARVYDFRCELVWEGDDDWSGTFRVEPR